MRGRSSSAKSRLRSAGYKCNLCGRRVVDAATLERHQKTIHNVSARSNTASFRAKSAMQRNKLSNKDKNKAFDDLLKGSNTDKDKAFDDLLKGEISVQPKTKLRNSKNKESLRNTETKISPEAEKVFIEDTVELDENAKSLSVEKEQEIIKKDNQSTTKKVEFECPVCSMTFNVYFAAHKHIQNMHSVNADGKKVASNSLDLVQPIRVEQCFRCNARIKSNEQHICPKITEEAVCFTSEYVCSGCNQSFVSMKTFDLHVSGLHSEGVDSMFFPTKIEFTNWRLEMERQTNARYILLGEYDSKKIYRCNFAREDIMNDKSTAYFCPSSMVVQDFSKGIQVHYYNKHYAHSAKAYTLSSKYKPYSITAFLKNPIEDSAIKKSALPATLDDKDLYPQFKKLMNGIALNCIDVDVAILKILIERALEMATVLTDSRGTDAVIETVPQTKPVTNMSDKEITEALQLKTAMHKRRRSVDSYETPPKPAKRTRNKSLFMQSDDKMSPKIINTFSLASNSNSSEYKADNDLDMDSTLSCTTEKAKTPQNERPPKPETNNVNKPSKINTKLASCFNESLSFNDSYKDFIDRTLTGRALKNKNKRSPKSTVKTKLGEFKQTSPKKVENNKTEEANPTYKVDTPILETPKVNKSKVNILSIETPNVTITKVKSIKAASPKMSTQVNPPRMDNPKVISTANTRAVFSPSVDPLQVNTTKLNKGVSSPLEEPHKGNVSKVNTRSVSSPPVDPLQLSITKVKTRSTSDLVELPNMLKVTIPVVDTPKLNITKVEARKSNTEKDGTSKLNSPKLNTPKVYPYTVNPNAGLIMNKKTTPKVITKFTEEIATSASSNTGITPQKVKKDFIYEVREQENDCNILVLKF